MVGRGGLEPPASAVIGPERSASGSGRPSVISFATTLGFYVAWVVGGLSDQWKQLKSLSIFTAYAPQKALESGSV
jgi:hypothetical protein